MIHVYLNRQSFQYDVHSLVRAFYPGEEVKVEIRETDVPEVASQEDVTDEALFLLVISFIPVGQNGGKALEEGEAFKESKSPEADEASAEEFQIDQFSESGVSGESRIEIHLFERTEGGWEGKLQKESSCCEEDRGETKNELKRLLYRLLSEYSGKKLPWGNLTGIRPTKIAMTLLKQGKSNVEIANYMRETYYTSNEKTALAVAIANREHSLLEKLNLNGYSLYIGIPFCPSICLYCSFSSSPIALWKDRVDAYLDALLHEMEAVAEMLPDRRPDTIYIGGGTPTTLEPEQLERLLSKLESCLDVRQAQEFTVEPGRPDSITREKLAVLQAHQVSRISINPQTMNQETLDFIGRKHTVEETEAAFYLAREMGFDNINMDLIVGLPGEGSREVEHTMQVLSRLDPDSITVHSLAVKRAARLRLFKEEHKELSFENNSEIMDMTAAYTRASGLHPYYLYRQKNMAGNFENVGYARDGREGLYNILIMEEVQSIVALGAGAATKLVRPGNRIHRIENVKDIRNYIERIDEMIERKRAGLYE
ncbi:MAG: coproporphyrinogen dehydrogenase HemZ [Lachnospiraceae bacterium]|nr:coproporphyrinogen dehydrogenase HemZ [Lachnospiraceae bacterium]